MTAKKLFRRHHDPCEAVTLLIQRMETNPEEFALNSSSKWHDFLNVLKRRAVDGDKDMLIILDDYETDALWKQFKAAGRKSLHNFVMRKILQGDKNE